MSAALKHRVLRGLDYVIRHLPAPLLAAPVNDRGERLNPFLQALRHLRSSSAGLDALALRSGFAADMQAMRHGYPIDDVFDVRIEGRIVRCYQPTETQRLPVVAVYFHGGGFVMGDLETHDDACRLLAETSGIALLAVDYRLAPEFPFPAAADDALAVARWVSEHLDEFQATQLAIAGDSAGGNLAAVTAAALAQEGVEVRSQLLMYPGTDLLTERPSQQAFSEGFFLNRSDRDAFYGAYLSNGDYDALAAGPRVSPLRHALPDGLAPALVVTAGFDMLRDEGIAFAQQLQRQAPGSRHLHFGALGHAFINLSGVSRACEQATRDIAAEWRELLLNNG